MQYVWTPSISIEPCHPNGEIGAQVPNPLP
jgi:hypothetical protein